MTSHDIPPISDHPRLHLSLGELLARVDDPGARWADIPTRPGLYLVLWPADAPLKIRPESGREGEDLLKRWQKVSRNSPTDILYIGKADSLRHRIRQLVRFGRGKAVNHQGGKDLWWVAGIERATVLIQCCPEGHQGGFENEALERFKKEHGDYPLANRQGPRGEGRWWPEGSF